MESLLTGFLIARAFVTNLNEMKREWTGMLVGPDEYEPKQPQLEPRKKAVDPQALLNPDHSRITQRVLF